MRRRGFILGGHQYKFGRSVEHFAKVNGLTVGDAMTNQAYKRTKAAAEADLKVITAGIMKGSVRQRSVYLKGGLRISLGLGVDWEVSGLQCDEIR